MGIQIIRQPDDLYAIFSSETDTIIVWDASKEEVIDWFAERAAERAREDAQRNIDLIAAGNSRRVYFQFAMTWEEALAEDREHGGDAWKHDFQPPTESTP